MICVSWRLTHLANFQTDITRGSFCDDGWGKWVSDNDHDDGDDEDNGEDDGDDGEDDEEND